MTSTPVARPDRIRRHNLALMLRHIHLDGALTRAELTNRLQVSRSTVGALVGDLTTLGLVEETVPNGGPGVGRPSHVVVPSPRGPWVAAVDVDVNHVVTAAVGLGGEVLARTSVEIDPSRFRPEDLAGIVSDQLATMLPENREAPSAPASVGVSVPGTVDQGSGRVGVAPNLGWHDVDLLTTVRGAPGLADVRVVAGNDADLAVLAEHQRGRARDCDDVVFIQGRFGIGAGIILGGRPVSGRDGHAGEIGHIVLDPDGPGCHCGKRGCVETYVGAPALTRAAGVDTVEAVFAAARAGDERASAVVRSVAEPLGRSIAVVVDMLNPQRVVLGGHLAELFDVVPAAIEEAVTRFALEASERSVQLVAPGLGRDAALLGAAEVAFADILDDPYGALTFA